MAKALTCDDSNTVRASLTPLSNAINPFTDLSHSERCLLDSHPWLADLTKDTP